MRKSCRARRRKYSHGLARLFCWLVFAAVLTGSVHPAPVDAEAKATGAQVKAAYLFNFAKYVKWPDDASAAKNDNFVICVLGRDPFGDVLDATVRGEKLDGRSIVVQRLRGPQGEAQCRMLFVSSSEKGSLGALLPSIKAPVLTVSDIPAFSEHGGMIEFVEQDGRVRFVVNLQAAQRSGLTVSSELLKVASAVRRAP